MQGIRNIIAEALDIDIRRHSKHDPLRMIARVLALCKINAVIDVGANEGQFALGIRKSGYSGEIHSFEPLEEVFRTLSRNAKKDPRWHTYMLALGNRWGQAEINVSSSTSASSLLNMLPCHEKLYPHAFYTGREKIKISKLDHALKKIPYTGKNLFLKIDTQGFELEVLRGASQTMKDVSVVCVEICFVPLYENAPTFIQLHTFFLNRGFVIYSILPGDYDKDGKLVFADFIFIKKTLF